MRKPNVIVFIADDHRHASIGINGCADVSTPHLDALGRRGTIFDGAHCQGSMHPAVCVPSRASLMTGRTIFASSCNPTADDYTTGQSECPAFTIPANLPTFPQRLREAGYVTHAIGKWHNDRAAFARSFSSGDRLFFGGMSDHDRVPLRAYDPTGVYADTDIHYEEGLSTDLFADAAVRFLRTCGAEKPFLLYVAFTAPHDPRTPPLEYARSPEGIALTDNVWQTHPFDNGDALVRDETLEAFPRTRAAIRQHLADYYGMIAHMDAAIGRILAVAQEQGILDDTVVIYTADHGLALGQHGLMGKQNLYDHSVHVPLMMAGPGIRGGVRVPHLVWHADTRATVLDVAGLAVEEASDGRSLLPLLRGEGPAVRNTFCAAYRTSQRMIRDERYKLIRYYPWHLFPVPETEGYPVPTPGSSVDQLFDLQADPGETTNLAWRPDLADVRERLASALEDWQRRSGDPYVDLMHPAA
ncbi:sulfatase-like hydrolase/transferase [Alsobacter sp. R-9]